MRKKWEIVTLNKLILVWSTWMLLNFTKILEDGDNKTPGDYHDIFHLPSARKDVFQKNYQSVCLSTFKIFIFSKKPKFLSKKAFQRNYHFICILQQVCRLFSILQKIAFSSKSNFFRERPIFVCFSEIYIYI